jgi:phytoene dehydrogenase-like protein
VKNCDPDAKESIAEPTVKTDMTRRSFLIGAGALGVELMGAPSIAKAASEPSGDKSGGDFDFLIVGSGINSLVAAAILAQAGRRVCVLERNNRLGGCIRTEELTVQGFKHDVLSGYYPLFVTSPAYKELESALNRHGLEFLNTDDPTAVLLPNNQSLVLKRDQKENVAAMNAAAPGDGDAYREGIAELLGRADLTFGLLGKDLWSYGALKLLLAEAWRTGLHDLFSFFGLALKSCRSWLEKSFQSELTRGLLAPWVLHTGLGPDSTLSGFMDRLIFLTLEIAGMPVVKGGSQAIVDAFVGYIEEKNGVFVVNADVEKILVEDRTAVGVETADGTRFRANSAVICNVTPTQLYQRLIPSEMVSSKIAKEVNAYQYGRGDMQIHLALSEPPQWPDSALKNVAFVHVTPGLNGVSEAVNQANQGLLPEEATIVVGQPTAMDPSRAPKGKWILWIQLQELPGDGKLKGDAAGIIKTPATGKWSASVAEQYADRIIDRLDKQIPNLKKSILGRKVLSPADLETLNINLVGGDPYSGICSIDQFFIWRPLRSTKNHTTPVKGLYHIGASTHPGPGLGGVSGYLTAKELLR